MRANRNIANMTHGTQVRLPRSPAIKPIQVDIRAEAPLASALEIVAVRERLLYPSAPGTPSDELWIVCRNLHYTRFDSTSSRVTFVQQTDKHYQIHR